MTAERRSKDLSLRLWGEFGARADERSENREVGRGDSMQAPAATSIWRRARERTTAKDQKQPRKYRFPSRAFHIRRRLGRTQSTTQQLTRTTRTFPTTPKTKTTK